jgi:transposase
MRARIVLRAAEGATNTEIANEVGVSLPTVGLWRRNFCKRRMDGLQTAPRSGRPREIDDSEVRTGARDDAGATAGREHALEYSAVSGRDRDLVLDGASDLA